MDGVIRFSDIIKNKFLQEMAPGDLTLTRVVLTLLLTFAAALYIQYIYRKTFTGVIYSGNFNFSLTLVALVTSLIIMPITSNLTLSLGMVGALSIVRFRTAVKEPSDTGFMFWAIAAGIAMGAGFYIPCALGTLLIGILMLLLYKHGHSSPSGYLLIVHHAPEASDSVAEILNTLPEHKLRSKTASREGLELIIELKLRENSTAFINDLLAIEGVSNTSLVSHQGEIIQ